MQIQQLFFTQARAVELRSQRLPAPGPGQLRLATQVSAISAGTELLVYRGQLPVGLSLDVSIPALQRKVQYPLQYGYCAVGRIVDGGPGVDQGLVGRQALAFQPHQSGILAAAEELLVLPADLPADAAAFLPNIETALGLVMDGAPIAGERVAVLGQGVVGLLVTAVLSGFPLEALTSFDRFPLRREASMQAGAHQVFAPDDVQDDHDGWFDLVFELSGSPAALDAAIRLAGHEGRIVVGSWYGSKRAPIDLGGRFHRRRQQIISSQVSSLSSALGARWTKARRMEFAVRMAGQIRPSRFITHRFPLDQAAEAYRLIDQQPESCLQVVFDYV